MASSRLRRDGAFGDGKWALWGVGGLILGLLLLRVSDLFAGDLPGIDDMMRLQQVRDLLAGQDWFLVDQSRFLTPENGEMHWSRLSDIFLAGLIMLTRPFLGQESAEIFAVITWPLMLLATAMVLLSLITQRLGLNRAGQAIALLFFATSAAVYNFWPGRIDHHGFVTVLVLAGLAALLSRSMSARSGVILAACITAALSIAIEGLPYVAGLIAILGLFWIVRGHQEGVRLAAFGAALSVFATFFILFDAPGVGARRMVCDAYGVSHWAALVSGGLLLAGLGVFGGWLDTWPKRMIAGLIGGVATLLIFAWVNPACLGDPYAAVPDIVRETWLNGVSEAQPLSSLIEKEPDRVIWVFGFLTVASLATVVLIWRARGEDRLARIGCALLLALSIVATIYQIRGQSFSHVFGAIMAGGLVGLGFRYWQDRRGAGPLLAFAGLVLIFSPMSWRTLGDRLASPQVDETAIEEVNRDCIAQENFTEMASRPAMKVFTPAGLGISVLFRTPHEIFVAPYHRNGVGIERGTTIFTGPTEFAHQRLLDLGATHLAYCVGLGEANRYGRLWPDGFAAQLNRDEIPDWLEPVDGLTETHGVVRLYRVETQRSGR